MDQSTRVLISKSDIRDANIDHGPQHPPAEGEIAVRLQRFALTTNNITYAATGEQLKYWQFFPSGREGAGIVPVWGFAEITASRCEDIDAGERLYGFLPMAGHWRMTPGNIHDRGFTDISSHRRDLPPVYNDYVRPGRSADTDLEDRQALLQPLFVTSWLLFDFLEDNGWFDAEQVIIGSASSKTGIGLAKFLAEARPGGPKVVGLTSPGNRGFCESLGAYDHVVGYEEIEAQIAAKPAVYVDMAGNAEVRKSLHTHLGEHMKHSAAVGTSHWDRFAPGGDLPGAKPQFFFAPAQVQKRSQEWGGDVTRRKITDAWRRLAAESNSWLKVRHTYGLDDACRLWRDLASGKQSPDVGHIVVLDSSR